MILAMSPAKRKTTPRKKVEDKRVYLVHSDQLRYDQYRNGDAQILVGNVHFRHMGANLYCDSANFFQQTNSFEAFGHVKMLQGDTLKLFSDYAYYDGNAQIAQARYNVILKHRESTLYTDSLDYDRLYNFGNFFEGGKLVDNGSTLTSDWGEYHTDTKMAIFYYDVRLRDKNFYLTTDSLYYDTQTSRAHIVGPSNITSGTSHIYSEDGYYNTKTETSELFGTFKLFTFNIHTDSVYRKIHAYNKVRAYRIDVQAVCDSLVYNSQDSCMTMYRDPIVWNGSQQLFGEEIRVYMKDSTINRAHVVGQAFSTEQMPDTVHFNQVSSKEMFAFFEKGEIRETDAVGNVLIVYYPVDESDSSLIGLNYTETPKMKMFLANRKMQKIWMEKPVGTLYPMTQIPPAKYFLPQYAWFDYIRPLNKADIFNWRPKKAGQELKEIKRREAPIQKIGRKEG